MLRSIDGNAKKFESSGAIDKTSSPNLLFLVLRFCHRIPTCILTSVLLGASWCDDALGSFSVPHTINPMFLLRFLRGPLISSDPMLSTIESVVAVLDPLCYYHGIGCIMNAVDWI